MAQWTKHVQDRDSLPSANWISSQGTLLIDVIILEADEEGDEISK